MNFEAVIKHCRKCGGEAEAVFLLRFAKGKKEAQGAYIVMCKKCGFCYPVISAEKNKAVMIWNTNGATIKHWVKRKYQRKEKSKFWKKRQKALRHRSGTRKIIRIFNI